jgi:signal peptidase I
MKEQQLSEKKGLFQKSSKKANKPHKPKMSEKIFLWSKERLDIHKGLVKHSDSSQLKDKKISGFAVPFLFLLYFFFGQNAVLSWIRTIIVAFVVVMILNGLALASFVVPTGSMENTVMTGDFLFVNKFIYGPSSPQVIPFINLPLPYFRIPGIKQPEKGDVIVFIYPGDRDEIKAREFQYYLKRCVATAGDSLQVINKRLFVNNVEIPKAPDAKYLYPQNNSPAIFPAGKNYTMDNYGPIRIPKKGDLIPISPKNIFEWSVFIQREGHQVSNNGNDILIDGVPTTNYTVQRDYCFGMGDNRDNSLDSRYWGFIPVENVVGTPIVVYWSWSNLKRIAHFIR